jgi:hypothetical protein
MHDPAVPEPEDGDFIDPLEPTTSRRIAEPWSQVGGRAGQPADDRVALGDQLHDLHLQVGEADPGRRDPALGRLGQLWRIQLVDQLQMAAVEDLADQPADHRLVGFGHHSAPSLACPGPILPRSVAYSRRHGR